jgi:hypothetical protein
MIADVMEKATDIKDKKNIMFNGATENPRAPDKTILNEPKVLWYLVWPKSLLGLS